MELGAASAKVSVDRVHDGEQVAAGADGPVVQDLVQALPGVGHRGFGRGHCLRQCLGDEPPDRVGDVLGKFPLPGKGQGDGLSGVPQQRQRQGRMHGQRFHCEQCTQAVQAIHVQALGALRDDQARDEISRLGERALWGCAAYCHLFVPSVLDIDHARFAPSRGFKVADGDLEPGERETNRRRRAFSGWTGPEL